MLIKLVVFLLFIEHLKWVPGIKYKIQTKSKRHTIPKWSDFLPFLFFYLHYQIERHGRGLLEWIDLEKTHEILHIIASIVLCVASIKFYVHFISFLFGWFSECFFVYINETFWKAVSITLTTSRRLNLHINGQSAILIELIGNQMDPLYIKILFH